jgi:hypothetical protein
MSLRNLWLGKTIRNDFLFVCEFDCRVVANLKR